MRKTFVTICHVEYVPEVLDRLKPFQKVMLLKGKDLRIARVPSLRALCIPQVWCKALDCLVMVWDLTLGR